MDTNIIVRAANSALLNIVLAVLALLAAYAVYYIQLGAAKLKAQTARIGDEAGRKVLVDALDDVERLALLAVGYTEQTVAKEVRDAVKSGKGSREKLLALGREVFEEVKSEISPEAQELITKNLGSFDHYLEQCIESAVLKVKREDPYLTISGDLLEGAGLDASPASVPEPPSA